MGGWILAELTMVLVIVVLGSEMVLPAAGGQTGPSHSPPTSSAGPSSSATPKPKKAGINTNFETCEDVMRSPKDKKAANRLHRCIVGKGKGKRPGLILVFGVTWDPSRPTAGEEVSGPTIELLKPLFKPDTPVMRAFMRSYLKHRTPGKVIAEAYYFQE